MERRRAPEHKTDAVAPQFAQAARDPAGAVNDTVAQRLLAPRGAMMAPRHFGSVLWPAPDHCGRAAVGRRRRGKCP